MTNTRVDLVSRITALAQNHWETKKEAMLLSVLGPELTKWDSDYKSILNGHNLRKFIEDNAPALHIAHHSKQFARVGTYPAKETFSYDDPANLPKNEPTDADKLKKSRRAFYDFIHAISVCDPEDLRGVHIPTSVIVRLLEGK